MPSYRFCRPDDIPYLVRAINECYLVHFPGSEAMTVDRYRDEMKHLDVWPSNAMVASTGPGPIAVMIGTKRAREVLISRIGVHPDHLRQGHGGHMLTSLAQKLGVLGPDRLIAELPRSIPGLPEFFGSAGYRFEASYTDYFRPPGPAEPVPGDWLMPVTVEELVEDGLLVEREGIAWERVLQTLKQSEDALEGLALASPERLEAFVLHRPPVASEPRRILALGGPAGDRLETFQTLLLRHLTTCSSGGLLMPKLAEDEVAPALLSATGFEPAACYDRYGGVAIPV